MDLIGKRVRHTKLKEGTIIEQSSRSITVVFDWKKKKKEFFYPRGFEKFLSFINEPELTIETQNLIQKENKEIEQRKLENKERKELYRPKHTEPKLQNKHNPYISKEYMDAIESLKSVDEVCNLFQNELRMELAQSTSKKIPLSNGILLDQKSDFNYYQFETDTELNIPNDTAVKLYLKGYSYDAQIISCDDFSLTLILQENIGILVPQGYLYVNLRFLMEALIVQFDSLRNTDSSITRELILNGYKNISPKFDLVNLGQKEAMRMSLNQKITMIWGPPGTGKTEVLAQIASEHLRNDNRILMVSYSNVSVDEAVLRTAKVCESMSPGLLIRYGYSRNTELLKDEFLTAYQYVLHYYPDLKCEMDELYEDKRKALKNSKKAIHIQERINRISEKIKKKEKDIVSQARFVATTATKATIDRLIYEDNEFDVVIFDEASMALVPQILYISSLAKKHFICIGDFCQLPPIVQIQSPKYLDKDIFAFTGISAAVRKNQNHQWLCVLATQYRMHSELAKFVSSTMYQDLLMTAPGIDKNRKMILQNEFLGDAPIDLISMDEMMDVCHTERDKSRFNILNALTVAILEKQFKCKEIGIITPYRAQAALIKALVQNENGKNIAVSTVHQFQGSERDIIIFDTVDSYRQKMAGPMFGNAKNDYANRLFNVAITRSRSKFILIANERFFKDRISGKFLVKKILTSPQYKKNHISAADLYADEFTIKTGGISSLNYYQENEAYKKYFSDLSNIKTKISLVIPTPIKDIGKYANQLNEITRLLTLIASEKEVSIFAEDMERLPKELQSMAISSPYKLDPITVIDDQLVWYGMPESCAEFIIKGNPVTINYRPKIRVNNKKFARLVKQYLEL